MDSGVILAIRKINDRAKGLVKNLGADNPITQQYLSRMETLVPDQYLREDKNGVLQISRSKDFEKMGYTAERDFNLDKFQGIQDLRKKYQSQYKQAKEELKGAGQEVPTKDDFIASMGELEGNIPLLYKNATKEGVQDAIETLKQSNNTYVDIMNVVDTIKGLENAEDNTEGVGSHTITFD